MDKETPVEKRAAAIESQLGEKLFNKKYYRSVNIDLTAAQQAGKKKTSSEDEDSTATPAKTGEDYKAILKGMGFNVD
jgi:hypothetical protein